MLLLNWLTEHCSKFYCSSHANSTEVVLWYAPARLKYGAQVWWHGDPVHNGMVLRFVQAGGALQPLRGRLSIRVTLLISELVFSFAANVTLIC